MFRTCREAVNGTGDALLERAKAVGRRAARRRRSPTSAAWSISIATIPGAEPEQIERILDLALDGLRYRPAAT